MLLSTLHHNRIRAKTSTDIELEIRKEGANCGDLDKPPSPVPQFPYQ